MVKISNQITKMKIIYLNQANQKQKKKKNPSLSKFDLKLAETIAFSAWIESNYDSTSKSKIQ